MRTSTEPGPANDTSTRVGVMVWAVASGTSAKNRVSSNAARHRRAEASRTISARCTRAVDPMRLAAAQCSRHAQPADDEPLTLRTCADYSACPKGRILMPSHQRADGEVRLRFEAQHARTALTELYQRAPCRVLFPATDRSEPAEAVLLTTSGGLTGGDRTLASVVIGDHARVTLATQAAEKIYRAMPDSEPAHVEVQMTVGAGAWAEWLAQETILFNGSQLHRVFTADVEPTGRLLAHETLVLGRTAMGERHVSGSLHDAWRIRHGGALIWADALHLAGDVDGLRRWPFALGRSIACSSVLYVGADAGCLLDLVRSTLAAHRIPSAATSFGCLLLARLMAEDALELRAAVMACLSRLRHAAAGLAAHLPRVWHC